MTTNPIVTIQKSPSSPFYEIAMLRSSFSEKGELSMRGSPIKDFQGSPTITSSMEISAKSFANAQSRVYVPYGERFLTVLSQGGKYHILQVDPAENDVLEFEPSDSSFLRTLVKTHHLGAAYRTPIEYHFFIPVGHQKLNLKPMLDPRAPREGPVSSQAGGGPDFYLKARTKT